MHIVTSIDCVIDNRVLDYFRGILPRVCSSSPLQKNLIAGWIFIGRLTGAIVPIGKVFKVGQNAECTCRSIIMRFTLMLSNNREKRRNTEAAR
jgi:hypothetical protein